MVPWEPKVGFHSDCVRSWDTLGGIHALGRLQGPLQTGFGVAEDGPVEVLAVLQGKFGWKTVIFFKLDFAGPRVPWGPHGRVPLTGFGVAQDGPVAVLAAL